jgi:hypothetical protein
MIWRGCVEEKHRFGRGALKFEAIVIVLTGRPGFSRRHLDLAGSILRVVELNKGGYPCEIVAAGENEGKDEGILRAKREWEE